MVASDVARLIIRLEETVNPDSDYYGKLIKWWDQEQSLWHYGIGLSNTHFFSIGTIQAQELKILKRHDIIEQRDLDIRSVPGVYSPFESEEIIERIKSALRWLNDLPEKSQQRDIDGKTLAFLIFTNNRLDSEPDIDPAPIDVEFEAYLKQNSPQLQHSKIRDFLEKGKNWAYIFLFGFGLILTFVGFVPGFEGNFLIRWGSRLLFVLVSALALALILLLISTFKWSGFQKKKFWDWLQLLIVPLMLAFAAFFLNYTSANRDKRLAEERRQQEILRDYYSKMQDLILAEKKNGTDQPKGSQMPKWCPPQPTLSLESSAVARSLTLAVLDELNPERKAKVISYLSESCLIGKAKDDTPEVNLAKANLKDITLEDVDMPFVKIRKADMSGAKLTRVSLASANLEGSILRGATFTEVDFSDSFAKNIDFSNTTLVQVNLNDTDLSGGNFDGVSLQNVKVSLSTNFEQACYNRETNFNVGDQSQQYQGDSGDYLTRERFIQEPTLNFSQSTENRKCSYIRKNHQDHQEKQDQQLLRRG